jgi:hypothetical protein
MQVIIFTVPFIDSESSGFEYYDRNLDLDFHWTPLHKTTIHGYSKVSYNIMFS